MQVLERRQNKSENRSRIAAKAFFNLVKEWGLTNEQQIILLGSPSKATFHRWKKGAVKEFSQDTLERISYLLGIYKALHIIFNRPEQANSWIHRDNQAELFAGKSALQYMLQGKISHLYEVRKYLDAQRG